MLCDWHYYLPCIIIYLDINKINDLNFIKNYHVFTIRVHVATIVHHIERITKPMINLRADKAYLITFGENDSASGVQKVVYS